MSQSHFTLAELVMARCEELATYSEQPDRLTRRFLTSPMHGVHDQLSEWMRAAQLDVRIDHGGNFIGRRTSAGATRTLLVGSHLDTVPDGGRYDGVLGVLMGLVVASALGNTKLPFHLDVIGFSEEEGIRFNKPYLGSSAVAGSFREEWLDRTDAEGVTLRQSMATFGLDPSQVSSAAYAPEEVIGYLEPHLEQGPVLQQENLPVGVVSGIAGQSRLRLEFMGNPGHAGTTPMLGRCDALASAAEFICAVRQLGGQVDGLRATVGKIQVKPNAPNVIPACAELSLDVRHLQDLAREQAVDALLTTGHNIAQTEGTVFRVLENTPQNAVAVDAELSDLLSAAVATSGHEALQLPSGAGHDAVVMAKQFPMAMLFLRHPGGVSHHPEERVECADVAVGIEVLERFVRSLAEKVSSER